MTDAETVRRLWGLFITTLVGTELFFGSALAHAIVADLSKIETIDAILAFEEDLGDQWKHSPSDLVRDARLDENFRILIPRSDYEPNY